MRAMDYDSPSVLKQFLDERGMAMQKKFGQNFLINPRARTKIAESLELQKDMCVWEIGSGLGCLSAEILKRGGILTAFEIDRGFIQALNDIFFDEIANKTFRIVAGDVLKTWKNEYRSAVVPERVCGNLPYNIASRIIADTVSEGIRFERCVFTVQKEVAQRMAAKPASPAYSSFSVLCTWAYDVQPLMDLAGGSFWPRPNVCSQAVVLTAKKDFPGCKDIGTFLKIQRGLFASRRKTVKNNTAALYSVQAADTVLKQAGIDPLCRAETLDIKTLCALADAFYEYENEVGKTKENKGKRENA